MGKKHREKRKLIKSKLPRGWKENEFGDLVRKFSKADARRIILEKHIEFVKLLHYAENQIIELAAKKAYDEIIAIEDARIFEELNEAYSSFS